MRFRKIVPHHRYFESQEKDEEVIFIIRRHWVILIVPFIIGAFVFAIIFGASYVVIMNGGNILGDNKEAVYTAVFSLAILYNILYIFFAWLLRYLNITILTTKHFVEIKQMAPFSRKTSVLDLGSIEDVSATQKGILATLFHYGGVLVQTAGELPNFNIYGVGDPSLIQRKIMEAKDRYGNVNGNHVHTENHNFGAGETEKPEGSF